MLPAAAHASGCAGTPLGGSDAGKYAIASRVDLEAINTDVASLGCSYKLTADIDLSGAPWVPIGGNAAAAPFSGTFDGDGHSVTGLLHSDGSTRNVGLFGRTSGATIRSISVSGSVVGLTGVGGLVGSASGTLIEDAHSAVTISIPSFALVGGLVGELEDNSVVRRSSATGNVSAMNDAGGLVGSLSASRIEYSYATGEVSAWGAGGLVGFVCSGDISNSYATGDVSSFRVVLRDSAGGLVGEAYDLEITHSYAIGTVSGTRDLGGIIGVVNSGRRSPREETIAHTVTSFWNPTDSGLSSSETGTESTQSAMKDIATYNDKGWTIVQGWLPFAPNSTKWGICAEVNNGYPFLLWEYSVNPCAVPEPDPTEVKNPGAGEGTSPIPGLSGEFLSSPIAAPIHDELPSTGMNTAPIVIVALLMLGAGAAIVTVSKRRLAR